MKTDKSPQKISTNTIRNIILTFLCFPPVFIFSIGITSFFVLEPIRSLGAWVPGICFLSLGINIAVVCGSKVMIKLASDDLESAIKISKRSKKGYIMATIVIWLLGINFAIALPGLSYSPSKAYQRARLTVDNLINAQDSYHQINNTFTMDLDKLSGWIGDTRVEVIIHKADSKCWSATVKANGISRFFTYDNCDRGLMEIRSIN